MKQLKNIFIIATFFLIAGSVLAQSDDQNYIHTFIPLIEMGKVDPEVPNRELAQTIQYFDGLGRPLQVVQKQFSPNENDFVQPIKFDEFGRQKTEYLPYASASTDGSYRVAWDDDAGNPGELLTFYTNTSLNIANTLYPLAEKEFDNSPLNRTMRQGFPGVVWQLDGKPASYAYETNTADDVKYFSPGTLGFTWSQNSYYDAGSLVVIVVTDENQNNTLEYIDKRGRVVLKESILGSFTKVRTYYIYDDHDNLVYVISPEGSDIADGWTATTQSTQDFLDKYCYCYDYDARNLLFSKKLPGKEYEEILYDDMDRVILTNDGNLRAQGKWNFIHYDNLSRPVKTGLLHPDIIDMGSQTIQEYIHSSLDMASNSNFDYFDEVSPLNPMGYTNSMVDYLPGVFDTHTFTWYDNYDFIPAEMITDGYGQYVQVEAVFDPDDWEYNTGRITGTAVKVLDNSNTYLYTINYYDKFGRVIQSVSQNHLGGYDRVSTGYDFTGNVEITLHEHNINNGPVLKEWYQYTYDHRSRMTQVDHRIGEITAPWVIMAAMQYNELGQLTEKGLHYDDQNNDYWQNIDYKYNVRGWLTNINRASLSGNGAIIDFDESLEAIMMVSEIGYDSIYCAITEVIGGQGESDCLQIELSENPIGGSIPGFDTPSDLIEICLYEADITEAEYDTLRLLSGSSCAIDLTLIRVDEHTSVMDVLRQMDGLVQDQIPLQDIHSETHLDFIAMQLKQFLLNSLNIHYINEDGDNDLFGMDIFYNTGIDDLGSENQFNGNISAIAWKTSTDANKRGYGFRYDNLNRLSKGRYGEKSSASQNFNQNMDYYSVDISQYDLNGNITSLQRNTADGSIPALMDDLTYTYDGNRLETVEDASTISEYLYDFKDHSHQSQEYFYDANGNITEDMNKGIEVTYNHMNLPEAITFEDGNGENKIEYLYDANGVKLSKRVTKNGSLTYDSPRDYVGNFVYAGQDGLELILTQEGVVDVKASQYQYYLKDHLGNTRVMFTKVGSKVETLQESHYYPFGMRFARGNFIANDNRYLYNGKELQDDGFEVKLLPSGEFRYLDWYDYGARFYDVQLGRWHVVDNMADKYFNLTTYCYVANNPMMYIDPDGMEIHKYGIDDDGNVKLLEETNDNYDELYRVDNHKDKNIIDVNKDGSVNEADGIRVNDQSILKNLEKEQTDYNGDYAISSSLEDIGNVFLFSASNTDVEWSFQSFYKDKSKVYATSTSHKTDKTSLVSHLPQYSELDLSWSLHSHPGPNGTKGASYASGVVIADWDLVQDFYRRWIKAGKDPNSFPTHGIYHKETSTIYYYTPWERSIKGPIINKSKP